MASAPKRYVIIGSSAASIGVLGKLRALDPEGEITCLTASGVLPYNTCLLADYVGGERSASSIFIKNQEFFDQQRIKFVPHARVTGIDREKQIVETVGGDHYTYNRLFIGVGTSVVTPALPGLTNTDRVFHFQTAEDAQALDSFVAIHRGGHVVIVGAGLSGVECSDALVRRGMKVTLIERARHILPTQVDKSGAYLIEKRMCQAGVALYTATSVEQVRHQPDGSMKIVLSSGEKLTADALVLATGNVPNSALACDAGLTCVAGGIAVDEHMQTSDPAIFAGGDCAAVHEVVSGEQVRSCMWPDAMQQGMCAARAMTGNPKQYPGLLIVGSSRFYDTTFVSCGPVAGDASSFTSYTVEDMERYGKFICQDGRLVGFLLVGIISHVGLLRRAVINQEQVDQAWVDEHFGASES